MSRKNSTRHPQEPPNALVLTPVKPSSGEAPMSHSNDKTNSSYPGSQSSSHNSSGGRSSNYSSGSSNTYFSHKVKPTPAFEIDGIEFWGSGKDNLDGFDFRNGDLIINCTGFEYVPKPFVKKAPAWFSATASDFKPDQILLEWADMSPPPSVIEIEFWESILLACRKNDIKRVICCCTAGLGRTGTILASFLVASGEVEEPEDAIDFVRKNYNGNAIETKDQARYIFSLVYDLDSVEDDKDTKADDKKDDSKDFGYME